MAPQNHMDEFNTKTGKSASPHARNRNAVEFDPVEFMHFLEETDWSDDQKAEYVTLVWNIVCEFVALGFGVHPIQQAQDACGKFDQPGLNSPTDPENAIESLRSYLQETQFDLAVSDADGRRE